MACSINSDTIKIIMNGKEPGAQKPRFDYRSAVQNPDISRFQLNNILGRKGPVPAGALLNRDFWASFFATATTGHANTNTPE